jgi:hypothetical protein
MAEGKAHVLVVRVSYPKAMGEGDLTKIDLSFRLPQWALANLKLIIGVTVKAERQNHILYVVTPCWEAYRVRVLNLIASSNGNALREQKGFGGPGYDVRVEEQVIMTRTTTLTPTDPELVAV